MGFPGPVVVIADPAPSGSRQPDPVQIAEAGALCMLYGKPHADAAPGAMGLRLYDPKFPGQGSGHPLPETIPWTKADLDPFRVDHPSRKIRRSGWPEE